MLKIPAGTKLLVSDYSGLPDNLWGNFIEPNIQQAIENYLFYGWEPGSFTTALLANDMYSAVGSMHPGLSNGLKDVVTWVVNVMPAHSYGNYTAVENWMNDTDNCRSDFTAKVSERIMWRMLKND